MNDQQVGEYWNNNAEAWTELSRAGYDVYRDHLNTPAFMRILPDVSGLKGLDIGCGEGHNTRLLKQQGAQMTGIDIAEKFVQQAQAMEAAAPDAIVYHAGSASALPFADGSFDFATSVMCLMDVPDPDTALKEAYRVLQPGGFLQFSITHPCFATPHRKNLRNLFRKTYAIEVGDYFKKLNGKIEEWIFGAAPAEAKQKFARFRIPLFNRTLSEWMNALIDTGFVIERMGEPYPDDDTVKRHPELQDAQVVAYFMHIRCRKPLAGMPL